MDQLNALATFVAIAERRSFSAAARATGQTAVATTRQIAQLERHYGMRLFHRSTRAVTLTDAGTTLLGHARAIIAAAEDADAALRGVGALPQGQLHVTAPTTFGRLHVLPVVEAMLRDYPGLSVQLLLIDRNVRIVEEGIDVAVRIGPLRDTTLKALRIGEVAQVIVASPDYLARRPAPAAPADLLQHDIVATNGPRSASDWRFGRKVVALKPRLIVNTVDSAIAAAEAGVGIANLLSYQVEEALRTGRLIALLKDQPVEPLPVHLLFADRQSSSAATRVFLERMAACPVRAATS